MRTFPCPFCQSKIRRDKLADHIEKEHDNEAPENLSCYQIAYDVINNHPDHTGICMSCGGKTGWNNKTQKYFRVCKNPKCKEAVKKQYRERMMRVHGKIHLLDDENHLEKMLAGRHISGKYKWSDGTIYTYTGSYEKNFLEFLDKTMEYESRQVYCPGPVLVYKGADGKDHKWITDFCLPDYNLIIEIKDGGDNKNKKNMFDSRLRMEFKEKMITNQGTYNYLKLTNNQMGQFLGILAELKMKINDDDNSGPIFRINEAIDAGIDPYAHYADKLKFWTECARYTLDKEMYDPQDRIIIEADETILESPDGDDVSVLAFLYPKEDIIFENAIDQVLNEVAKYNDPKYEFTGFYLDESDHNNGYALGIKLSEQQEVIANGRNS